jgi:beta-phosphoglucomutase-like phosphatase (HAD superfamily)
MQLKLSDFDGVAFDFDGTLADSYRYHEQVRFETFTAHGFGDITMAEHQRGHLYGNTTYTIIGGLLKAAGKIPQDVDVHSHPTVQAMVKHRDRLYQQVAQHGFDAHTGAVEFVHDVKNYFGNKILIVTAAFLSEVLPFLKKHNLQEYFSLEQIITHETIVELGMQSKPEPDSYQLAMKRLAITDPARLLVIEDSTGGVGSAKRAGATVVALGTSLSRADFFSKNVDFHPDYFVRDFSSIKRSA